MINQKDLEAVFDKYETMDFKWIDPKNVVTAQWVRFKCIYGCKNYGKHACCPPNVPSVSECRQLFDEYDHGVIFHFAAAIEKQEDRHFWYNETNQTLSFVEREIFLKGYQKALLLTMDPCGLCEKCTGKRELCVHPRTARPTPEAMAVDVYATVRKYDFPVEVLTHQSQRMNRYAILLIE